KHSFFASSLVCFLRWWFFLFFSVTVRGACGGKRVGGAGRVRWGEERGDGVVAGPTARAILDHIFVPQQASSAAADVPQRDSADAQ
ncbi:hypothetical protein, partial [Klebsiella pneumoniae]|uniref:hypothetical protein n=1 Tax=Klebsiella pneumoniae TaxID=573 RepID=UPI001F4A4A92